MGLGSERPIKSQTTWPVCLSEPTPCAPAGPDHSLIFFVSVWIAQTPLAALVPHRKLEILCWIAAAATSAPPLNALISKLHPCMLLQQTPTHTLWTKGCPCVSLKREERGGEGRGKTHWARMCVSCEEGATTVKGWRPGELCRSHN